MTRRALALLLALCVLAGASISPAGATLVCALSAPPAKVAVASCCAHATASSAPALAGHAAPCCCHIEAAPERPQQPAVILTGAWAVAVLPAPSLVWAPFPSEAVATPPAERATTPRGPPPRDTAPRAPPASS